MRWHLTLVDCHSARTFVYSLHPRSLGLDCNASHDVRLPLHVVIYSGDMPATQRILACRPDLASAEAIDLAFHCARFKVAAYLMEQRQNDLPLTCVENGNVALLQLLRTYTTIGWRPDVLRRAITQRRSLDMATYLHHT
ncbi:hypothetical protein SPRG_15721, partial [Saprolegnia parasitica CBS 223.65]